MPSGKVLSRSVKNLRPQHMTGFRPRSEDEGFCSRLPEQEQYSAVPLRLLC